MNSAISINNVTFGYESITVPQLKNISLFIPKGKRFGLFGPNGAGKTTLMSLITGLVSPNEGEIFVLDKNRKSEKKEISKLLGFVPQDFSFFEELSPIENMEFFGAWYGLSASQINIKTEELLKVMGLWDVKDNTVKKFSGGMKRRINLAIAVMHQPAILLLDEPTVGVDVQSRNAIIQFLTELNAAGTTLLYTSHQLREAEDLCEEIALIDQGSIIAQGNIQNLLETHQQMDLESLFLKLTGRNYRD